MKKILTVFLISAFLLSATGGPGLFADELAGSQGKELAKVNEQLAKLNKDLVDQIKALTSRVNELESRIGGVEKKPVEAPPTYIPSPEGKKEGGVLRTLEDIRLEGFVDTSYTFNFDRPSQEAGRPNNLRVLDTRSDNFDLHALELDFIKPAPEKGGVGFRADLVYGLDAMPQQSNGFITTAVDGNGNTQQTDFAIQQAYIDANLPINGGKWFGDNVNIQAGKFVTLAGMEVLESKDNWNFSRSMGFGYGVPFTHTGVRTNWSVLDGKLKPTIGISNGWDQVVDINRSKTLEFGLGATPLKDVDYYGAVYLGPEENAGDGQTRFLYSNVLKWKTPIEKLSLASEVLVGNQRNVPNLHGAENLNSALWNSYALYAKYDLTEKLYVAWRGELFLDNDSFRTDGDGGLTVAGRRFWGNTLTLDYRYWDNLITRLELRVDSSDSSVYDVAGDSSQTTLATEIIYVF